MSNIERERIKVYDLDFDYCKPEGELEEEYDSAAYCLAYNNGIYENDDIPILESVHEEETYSDLEKGYREITLVFQRAIDGKFFSWSYTDSPYHSVNESNYDEELVEVFEHTKTVKYYA